jgi:hypothetical protein
MAAIEDPLRSPFEFLSRSIKLILDDLCPEGGALAR